MVKLVKQTKEYVVDTENEVKELISTAKQQQLDKGYTLTNYSSKIKEKKSKGEVIASWFVVHLVETYE